jgi:type IV pilus assembly protein PilY1
MKAMVKFLTQVNFVVLAGSLLLPVVVQADPGNQYCITPPFITAGVKPNLLLMIDNSASMYDPAYADPATYNFCANSPATSCATVGATCAGAAICKVSATTTTTTTNSPMACTADADCRPPNPGGVINDQCKNGQCNKAVVSVTTTTTTPTACTTDADCPAAGDSCNNRCTVTSRPCLDTTYSNTGNYPGYFSQTANYCYSTLSGLTTCTYSGSFNEFDGNGVMPASCTYGGSSSATPFVCVNLDGTSGKVNNFVATGRFLNWLTMSKFDIEKSILTGGKHRTDLGGDIAGETRGCAGRKYIKTLPALPGVSFAVRGGSAAIGNTSQASQYGTTYVEIYKGTYNVGDCTAALNDWQNVTNTNLGPLQVDTKNCIGGTGSISDSLAAANQSIHDCFWYFNGHGLTNLQPIKNVCQKIYQTKSPGDITDPNAPDAICSNSISHAASLIDGNTTGYLGSCFTNGTWDDACALKENKDFCQALGGAGAVTDPSSETVVPQTVQNVPGFVMELGLGNLEMINDYTTLSPVPANATKGFPLLVYDPWHFFPWPPTGLIQKYSNNIRFGAISFQNNGSGSECAQQGTCSATSTNAGSSCTTDAGCTGGGKCIFPIPCSKTCSITKERQCYQNSDCPAGETCAALAKTDGGKVVAYVGAGNCSITTTTSCTVDADCAALSPSGQYCAPSIGDHNAGLLRSIDDVQATSWTPFAEGFYNALGYFARANAYTDSPPTSRSDANLSSLPSPNTAASFLTNKNPSQFRCQSNNVLLITDGMSTADSSSASEALATLYAPQVPYTIGTTTYNPGDAGYNSDKNHGYDTTNRCPPYSGSRSVSNLAWVAKNRNIKTLSTSAASTTPPGSASESITTYVVYSGPPTTGQPELCDPKTLMTNTAINGGTTLYSATDPATLYSQLDSALSTVAAKAASGTAASILSNSEGSGANILQAVFYPRKIFDNSTSVNWVGEMQNLWYYVDPYIRNSTIREDTDNDLKLKLTNDDVVRFTFDNSVDKTMVQRYADADGDGVVTDSDKVGALIDPDYIKSIWRAGMKLWERSEATDSRTIYTGFNSTSGNTPQKFSNLAADGYLNTWPNLWNTMQIPAGTDPQRQALATKLISYIRGTDQPIDAAAPCLNADCTYRNRKVTMGVCSGNTQKRCTPSTVATDCPSGNTCISVNREWKLGDIISSTPRVQSTIRLNTYNLPYPGGYSDTSYDAFINTSSYKSRGVVYVGANDGMLHAFNLGVLSVASTGTQKASLTGTSLGAEKWAFIPKNALPYLKYTTDKDYSHLYFIDGRTVIFDASVGIGTGCTETTDYWKCDKDTTAGSNWRTIVIAGMGLGGASRNNDASETCTEGASGSCVKTPVDGTGASSYFALDVTNPDSPKYLWEFSHNLLGYSLTAPAIVRIGDKNKNGRWFAVFGNGPFGPIDTGTHQFKGQSNYNLRFFVVDLLTGQLLKVINDDNSLGISNAFSGALLGGSVDADRRNPTAVGNYQDDAVYAGYVMKASDDTWSDGGVVRIMTKEDMNPANWVASKVIDGIGPVTTAISRIQDTRALSKNLWLFFGTGRYYYRDGTSLDDYNGARSLFGIKEPCYNTASKQGNFLDGSCTSAVSGTLVNQTSTVSADTVVAAAPGWRVNLNAATATEGAERVVTDTVALTNGTVTFTTFKPTMDICGYGGNSFLRVLNYDTGGFPRCDALQGKVLIQLSTGEFKEISLAEAYGCPSPNGNVMPPVYPPVIDEPPGPTPPTTPPGALGGMTGKPPSDAPPVISNSLNRPVKKILHIQER